MATNGTQDQERRHTGEWRAAAGEAPRLERAALTRAELLLIVAFWTFMAILTAANGLLDPRARMVEPVIVAAPVVLAFIVSYAWAILTPGIFLLVDR